MEGVAQNDRNAGDVQHPSSELICTRSSDRQPDKAGQTIGVGGHRHRSTQQIGAVGIVGFPQGQPDLHTGLINPVTILILQDHTYWRFDGTVNQHGTRNRSQVRNLGNRSGLISQTADDCSGVGTTDHLHDNAVGAGNRVSRQRLDDLTVSIGETDRPTGEGSTCPTRG